MSYEVHPSGAGMIVRAKIESSYGTDPTIADGDVKYCEEVESDPYPRESLERPGMSGFAGGFRRNAGRWVGTLALTVPLYAPGLANASARPEWDVWLRAAGWSVAATDNADYTGPGVPTATGGDDDIIVTYTCRSQYQESCRVHVDLVELGQADAIRHVHPGSVFDWTLTMEPGQPIRLALDGQSLGAQPASIGSAPSLDDAYTEPVDAMGLGMYISVERVANGAIWGGGTVGAPNTAGAGVVRLELTGNANIQPRPGLNGAGGVVALMQAPSTQPSGSLSLDLVSPGDWDWWESLDDSDVLHIRAVTFAPGSTTELIEVSYYCQVSAVAISKGDAIWQVDLELAGAFPPDSSDGGGLLPGNSAQIKVVQID